MPLVNRYLDLFHYCCFLRPFPFAFLFLLSRGLIGIIIIFDVTDDLSVLTRQSQEGFNNTEEIAILINDEYDNYCNFSRRTN